MSDGDFSSGYSGGGPTTRLGMFLYAIGSVAGGVGVLVVLPDKWPLAVMFFVFAALFVVLALTRDRIRAWSRRRRPPGTYLDPDS